MELTEESDAVLAAGENDTMVYVNQFAVCISKSGDDVLVEVFAKGYEDCLPIGHVIAYESDAQRLQYRGGSKNCG